MTVENWLTLPATQITLWLAVFFGIMASFLCTLSFNRQTRKFIYSFNGISSGFYSSILPILGIMIGFLSSNVWDSNKKASDLVRQEAAELTTIYGFVAVSGLPYKEINRGIRDYVSAVVEKEWPSMSHGKAAPEAEVAQDNLLRITSDICSSNKSAGACDHALFDIAMKVRETRANRLKLSSDNTETIKWASVLSLAIIAQISIAAVHLEKQRSQMASLAIFTSAIIVVLSLIALHELPFAPPLIINPDPIVELLGVIPES